MKYRPALDALTDTIKAAGLRAGIDWRGLNPPAVWIQPGPLTRATGAGWNAAAYVTIVVPAAEESQAFDMLDALTEPLIAALESAGYPVTAGEPVTVGAATQAAPLPALRFTTEIYLGE